MHGGKQKLVGSRSTIDIPVPQRCSQRGACDPEPMRIEDLNKNECRSVAYRGSPKYAMPLGSQRLFM